MNTIVNTLIDTVIRFLKICAIFGVGAMIIQAALTGTVSDQSPLQTFLNAIQNIVVKMPIAIVYGSFDVGSSVLEAVLKMVLSIIGLDRAAQNINIFKLTSQIPLK